MARRVKSPTLLVIVLLVTLAALTYYVYSAYEAYRNIDCLGITCPEGEFCQDNTCKSINPPNTNNYF